VVIVAVGASLLVLALLGCGIRLLLLRRRRSGAENSSEQLAEGLLAGSTLLLSAYTYDVFLSYRRSDFTVCDLVSALLEAEQLRVFKDRDGHLAGRPFDQALARAIMESATFAPVITLSGTQLLTRVTESSVDCAPTSSMRRACVRACVRANAPLLRRRAGGVHSGHPLPHDWPHRTHLSALGGL
jgi:hypothetical protein